MFLLQLDGTVSCDGPVIGCIKRNDLINSLICFSKDIFASSNDPVYLSSVHTLDTVNGIYNNGRPHQVLLSQSIGEGGRYAITKNFDA